MTPQLSNLSGVQRELLARLRRGDAPPPAALPRREGDGPARLSYAQEQVFFTGQVADSGSLFNLTVALPMSGPLADPQVSRTLAGVDAPELRRRLAPIVASQESMRTCVRVIADEPVQHVEPVVPVEVPEHEVTDQDVSIDDLHRLIADIGGRPFQLDQAPLWRVELIVAGDDTRVLVVTVHHLIADAISLALLLKALLIAAPQPDLPVRYRDYAAWHRAQVEQGAFDRHLEYWREQLVDLPPPLRLPTDRVRPATPTYRGGWVQTGLPDHLGAQVVEFARETGTTPYAVLLAAFHVLLHRHAGADDIVVGINVSGRGRPELQDLIGMFVNLVPLRTSLTDGPAFRRLVDRVRDGLLSALDHAELPFERLVNDLRPRWGGTHPALVQVGFNMATQDELFAPTQAALPLPVNGQGAHLDLTAQVLPGLNGSFRLVFEYALDLFTETTARRMLDGFVEVLEQALSAPDEPVIGPPAVGAPLLSGSATVMPTATLPTLIGDQAARTPDAVAVRDESTAMTYGDLERRANGLAHRLRALGVVPETRVGVCLPRSVDLVVALLAVWRAGGAYVPLDSESMTARSRFVLRETAPLVVITDEAHTAELSGEDHVIVVLAATSDDPLDGQSPTPPDRAAEPPNAAYVMYTSGSTGDPKGVVITHAGITNRLMWSVREHGLDESDRILQKTSLMFDAAGWEIFAPLASGGTVVLAPPGAERDPVELMRLVAAERITALQAVPSLLHLLVDAPGWAECDALRLLFSAGEPLHAEVCTRLLALRDMSIHNTYGPTECAIDVTATSYDPAQTVGPVPIGRPIDNTVALVLDPLGRPVPEGLPGELYIGGPGVARGYLGQPALTAQRFVPDPYGPPGSRVYRTGDLVRLREDGALDFLGRADQQIKVNGVRIEPAEIEAVLLTHPGVTGAVVQSHNGSLVGYVQGPLDDAATPPSVADLRAFLRERLPDYLIPTRLICLATFPVTAGGKVDRRALPAPDTHHPSTLPHDRHQRAVAEIWQELLGVAQVGVDDDFFTLGGHSLMITRLAGLLRNRLGAEVTLRDLLRATTVAQQARLLARNEPAVPIVPTARGGPLPLSSGQRRLWFLDRLEPGSSQYVLPYVVRLRGALDVAALARALGEVANHHEILRTRYVMVNGEPTAVIDPSVDVPLPERAATEQELPELIGGEINRPFDLATGPVVRAALFRLAADVHVLVLAIHHIACDGWSMGVFGRDLRTAYAAAGSLPALDVQYADFATWQQARLDGPELADQLDYWRDHLAGAPMVELPSDRPRRTNRTGRGALARFTVPADLAERVLRIGRHEGAAPFMTLLAAFDALLSRYSGSEDLLVGTPIAGRTDARTEGLIGFFVNTLVLRADLSGEPSFRELVRRVRADALAAYANQELPFERIVDAVAPGRDLSRNPLFQIMFEFGSDPGHFDLDGVSAEPLWEDVPWRTAKFDLTLTLLEQDDGALAGWAEYATDLFDAATVEALVDRYVRLLESVATDPERPVSRIALLSADELRAFTEPPGPPDTVARDPDPADCLPSAISRRVAENPGATALVAGDVSLSYAELDDRAKVLAGVLRGRGVTNETRVAVCAHRGPHAVVALLGVLKAGGAYVPIDPDNPPERTAALIAESGATVVLTDADLIPFATADPTTAGEGEAAGEGGAAGGPPIVVPGDLAYVIYTSGSTGRPKGVMIDHRAYLHHCRVIADAYGIAPGDRVALLSSLVFDVAMDQIAATLLAGATIVVAEPELRSPARLPDWLCAHRVTHLEITPAHYREVMSAVRPRDTRLRHLKLMNVGSDVVTYADAQRWYDAGLPGRFLCNYGPTECTVTCTLHPVSVEEAGRQHGEQTIPIGRPVVGTRAYVLDDWLNPAPPGVPGELYLGGVRLARGYLGRPDLTAVRFVPDPVGAEPGARLYRTGDRVRRRADGTLEFLGRLDGQVKIRGFRIELGEVEATLAAHPAVRAAAVIAHRGGGEPELAAFVVPRTDVATGTEADVREWRGYLADRLPGYMVPAFWNVLDALPLTVSGKVDRRALPEPARLRHGHTPPVTPTQQWIAKEWAELLHLDRVGLDDDFFELGGHSLLATQVHSRLQEAFVIDLPLRRLFEATTVAALAAVVAEEVERVVDEMSDEQIEALLASDSASVEDRT